MKKYPSEVAAFIESKTAGRSTDALVALVNETFGTGYTRGQIRAYTKNHGLKNGMPSGKPAGRPTKKYPQQIQDFIRENAPGNGPKHMTELLNSTFGTSYTFAQIDAYYNNRKISSGLDGRFKKGQSPPNKGKKGYCSPGCEKGWFQKGNDNGKKKPVGSERIDCKDGYILVKTDELKYRPKHKVLWEAAYGPVPPGYLITFVDGDKTNLALNNLRLITKAENAVLNKYGIRGSGAEALDTALLVVKAARITHRRAKEKKHDRVHPN